MEGIRARGSIFPSCRLILDSSFLKSKRFRCEFKKLSLEFPCQGEQTNRLLRDFLSSLFWRLRASFVLHHVLDMNQFAIIACIGSLILTLTWPVASIDQWAFDSGQPDSSCSNSDVNFLRPQMVRAVRIANVTGNWLPKHRLTGIASSKPAFARKLLGLKYAQFAQIPFLGGTIYSNYASGVANLLGETGIRSALGGSHNVVRFPRAYEGPSTGFASRVAQITDSSQSWYTAVVET